MIRILEENEFFIVLHKPHMVSVHNQSPSLVEFLNTEKKPLHFVNRIDQETSGLMLIAQKPEHHATLSAALEQGSKIYRALLRGPWKKPDLTTLSLKWPVSDQAEGRKNPQGVASNLKPSETTLHLQRSNTYFTEVLAEIFTGRQHQIRKHCALLGQPIVGDKRYNESKYNERMAELYKNKRMHLHAEKITFTFKNKEYSFTEPYDLGDFFKS
jgi:23S rRNA-/tRNA-specific pseudouridylate synthase